LLRSKKLQIRLEWRGESRLTNNNGLVFRSLAATAVRTPIQIGENFTGLPPMAAALEAGASDFVMLQELLQIMDGMAVIPGRPGNGLAWNEEAVASYRLA
jgi:L-alanine-DL-glutamate epimerase-like enolase superfamily enzyme